MNIDNPIIHKDLTKIISSFDSKKLNKTRVLISGFYGMLATYVTLVLISLNEWFNAGIEVYGIGRNYDKAKDRFGDYLERPYFHFLNQSVNDQVLIDENLPFDYVIHAASPASPQYYLKHPIGVIEPNVLGTINLLNFAVAHKSKGFLFFSSCDAYGKITKTGEISEEDGGEFFPQTDRSAYPIGKLCGEALCHAYNQEKGLKTICIRFAHTYGPSMDVENDQRVFSSFLKNALHGENIVITSDGKSTRPFCYISDAISGVFIALLNGQSGSYNLCANENKCSVAKLASIIQSISPNPISIIYGQKDSNYLTSPVIDSPFFSSQKLKKLGWAPSVSVEEGFKRTLTYLLGSTKQ